MGDQERKEDLSKKEGVFSKAVRAGKRTYFFDVKATKNNEFYLTLTESKKVSESDTNFHFEKHKIFLYPEDFEKFTDGLNEVIDFINQQKDDFDDNNFDTDLDK